MIDLQLLDDIDRDIPPESQGTRHGGHAERAA